MTLKERLQERARLLRGGDEPSPGRLRADGAQGRSSPTAVASRSRHATGPVPCQPRDRGLYARRVGTPLGAAGTACPFRRARSTGHGLHRDRRRRHHSQVERHAAELIAQLHAIPTGLLRLCARHADRPAAAAKSSERPAGSPSSASTGYMHMARAAQREGQLAAHASDAARAACASGWRIISSSRPSRACCMAICGPGMCSCAGTASRASSTRPSHCGHPEIELAFTTMFGTFGPRFLRRLCGLAPLEPGFHATRSKPLQSLSDARASASVRRGLSCGRSSARSRSSASRVPKKNRPG